eukprot:TRINITY_DN14246_c0_g10_i1.p1 TRINITY_DN14246_c0_g10~~TRINITY_DN14246_c0_g10_i1.p1  ORF type:complete len:114 (+),score=43.22 TRINITY_DN14246_c0_g10_i1:137-478(+)
MRKTKAPAKRSNSSTASKAIKKAKALRPKRPLPAYFWYLKERRSGLKQQYPELTQKDLVKKAAEEWKALSKEKQKKFLQKAKEDRRRYEQELKAMNKKSGKREVSNESSDSTK